VSCEFTVCSCPVCINSHVVPISSLVVKLSYPVGQCARIMHMLLSLDARAIFEHDDELVSVHVWCKAAQWEA